MTRLRSIRWQLQAWHGLLLAVILGSLGVTAYHFEKSTRLGAIDARLQELTGLVANALRPNRPPPRPGDPDPGHDPAGGKKLEWSPDTASHFGEGSPFYYAIWLQNGPQLPPSPGAPPGVPPPGDPSGARTRGGFREVYFSPAPGDIVLVGTPIAGFERGVRALGWTLAGGGLLLFAGALLIDGLLIGLALRPIGAITHAAAKITHGDLSQRIDTRETESELGGLAAVLNETFARLEADFTRQARFTADAAHELRTPVSIILMHAQNGLASPNLAEDEHEALAACHRAAQRMKHLIEALLRLARLDARLDRHAEPVDLATLAADAVELLQPLAAERAVTLRADTAHAPLRGDADQLAQAITNLVTNAIQHSPAGGEVAIATRREGPAVLCEVADAGPGIAPAHLPHIFDRFYRADTSRANPQGRMGLGLAIAKAIAESHGGAIEIRGVEGRGATFILRLPASA